MEGKNEAVLVACGEECDAAPVFDINTGEKILYIPDCSAPPSSLAFAVGHFLAASRSDHNQPTSGGANKDQPPSSGASKDHPTSGGAIYFWDPNKLQQTHRSYIQEAVGPITCSKDGMYLAGGAHSGNAYIWELTRGALLKRWRAHKNAISFLSFSQDSSLVISGSKDGTVHVWCMISLFQAEESKPHEATKLCPIFRDAIKHEASITGILTIRGSPRPTLITSSLDGCCKVTELMSGRLLHMLELSSPVTAMAIDPLEHLLICGADDAAMYMKELHGIGTQYLAPKLSKNDCQVLYGHKLDEFDTKSYMFNRAPISALAFSSEGVWLVSGSKNCTVLIWDTTTWNVVRKLENKMGPVTNLLVIQNPIITRVHTRNSVTLEIPTLKKKFKPTNDTSTFRRLSGFSKNESSAHECYQSSNLLSKQILELEEKRTPEAIEMIVSCTIDEQVENQDLAQDLGDMVRLLQWKTLEVMEVRASLQ
ncbi:hypothetical protein ACP70R_041035 [Stipagrostis hirtigluma subsp. patula]